MTVGQQCFLALQLTGAGYAVFSLASAVTTLAVTQLVMVPFEALDSLDEVDEEEMDAEDSVSEPTTADNSKLLAQIVEHNPFCPACAPNAPMQPNTLPAMDLPLAALPYRVSATMESPDPLQSYATIMQTDTGMVGAFSPNQALAPGIIIESVGHARVVILNGTRREALAIGVADARAGPKAKPGAKPDKKSQNQIPGAEQAIECQGANSCTVERAFVEKLLANPSLLVGQAAAAPYSRNGEVEGFRLRRIKSGSLPKMLGLKNGDVITSVNGIDFDSIGAAANALQKLRNAPNLSVTVQRKGKTVTKDIKFI